MHSQTQHASVPVQESWTFRSVHERLPTRALRRAAADIARERARGWRGARAHFFLAALGFLTAPFLGPLSALGAPRLAGGSSTSSSGAVYTCARGDAW